MLIGEYAHNLDSKKRLAIPSKLRGEMSNTVVVTKGLDDCLFVYPPKEWEKLAQKLGELPVGQAKTRSFLRILLAGATETELDALGRILIPDYLKAYAHLDKKAIIVGMYNRLEIWDEEHWQAYKESAEKNTGEIAEQLGELGVY
jgi:MraZ protein